MKNLHQENDKLKQENSELRDKAHQAQVATKIVIFLAACGVVYFLEGVSPIAAWAVGIAAFYFLFLHGSL